MIARNATNLLGMDTRIQIFHHSNIFNISINLLNAKSDKVINYIIWILNYDRYETSKSAKSTTKVLLFKTWYFGHTGWILFKLT